MGLLDWCVSFGSVLASFFFLWWNKVDNYADPIFRLTTWVSKLAFPFSPYLQLTISEHGAERFQRSEFFLAVEAYLSKTCANRAHKLKADIGRHNLQVNIDDHEEVIDTYHGATVWWYASKKQPRNVISFHPAQEETRFYQVVFHHRDRDLIINNYLPYVFDEGSDASIKNRPRRLFTNKPSTRWNPGNASWSHVAFQHPATFDTLAMDPVEKRDLICDLDAFLKAKDYYKRVGKAWKRGYLLYGPPGTGKSTMIAAMANYLDYDVYDLELTAVKNNTELRKLFVEMKSRSIIVIEDIDCSVELTGKRKDKKPDYEDNENHPSPCLPIDPEKDEDTKMTLSGVLNFIDGLWSACGDERIIIFTTNNKDKLDPALIRRGRMDKHIKMSYCRFEAFKVLAKNYLDVQEHYLFGDIRRLLEATNVPPADVAENLMLLKWKNESPGTCLEGLVEVLIKKAEEANDNAVADAKRNDEQAADAKRSAQDDAEAAETREGRTGTSQSEAAMMGRALTVPHMTTMGSPSLIQVDSNEWVLDTSSLIHYTSNLRLLHELTTDDFQADQLQRGSVLTERFKVPEVSYVQGGSSGNVISVAQLARRHGLVTVFEPTCAYVRDHRATGQDIVGHAHLSNGVYVLDYLFIQLNKGGNQVERKEAGGSGGGGVGRTGGNGDDDTKEDGAGGGDGGTTGGGGGDQNEGTGESRDNSGSGGDEDRDEEMEDLEEVCRSQIAMFGLPRSDRTQNLTLSVFSTSTNELGRMKAFYVDSGAGNHVTWNGDVLFRYPQHLSVNTTKQTITGVSGSSLAVGGIGYVVSAGGSLDHVLFVPGSVANLVSVSQLSKDYTARVQFYIEKMWIERIETGERIGQGYLADGLYVLDRFEAKCLVQRCPS